MAQAVSWREGLMRKTGDLQARDLYQSRDQKESDE